LENAVFFTTDPYRPQRQMAANVRANFAGCAFCHEVKAVANAAPTITKPVLVDRWMPRIRFNHASHEIDPITHEKLDCNRCHRAMTSRETSDLLMPVKADCVSCHSPQGKVVSDCITCHKYHAPSQVAVTGLQTDGSNTFKQMLLGNNRDDNVALKRAPQSDTTVPYSTTWP
jgi:predicted CXXCH cytochrome family protein